MKINMSRLREIIKEEYDKLNEKVGFYSSNFDKVIYPKERGWYIGFHTPSGDDSFVRVDRKPKNLQDARKMLLKFDIYADTAYWAEVK